MPRSSDFWLLNARARMRAGGRLGRGLPALLAFTDPARIPDPLPAVRRLPRGCGLVVRAFGGPEADARRLVQAARRRGLVVLIGQDASLAKRLRADGVHLPERAMGRARALRRNRPHWWITAAWHPTQATLRTRTMDRRGLDALVLSPVFPSASPSATVPLGPRRAGASARAARMSVYALGGITAATMRLVPAGFVGAAAVEAALKT